MRNQLTFPSRRPSVSTVRREFNLAYAIRPGHSFALFRLFAGRSNIRVSDEEFDRKVTEFAKWLQQRNHSDRNRCEFRGD